MSDKYTSNCRAVLRSVQFRRGDYEGREFPEVVGRFEILDGDDAGKVNTWFGSLSEDLNTKGKPFCDYTIAALRACGWTGDDFSELPELAEANMLANEVTVVREHVHKDDKWYVNIKYVNGGGGLKLDLKDREMSEAEVLAFAKRMKSRLGNRASSAGNHQASRAAAPPSARRPSSAPPRNPADFDDRRPPPYDPLHGGQDEIPF